LQLSKGIVGIYSASISELCRFVYYLSKPLLTLMLRSFVGETNWHLLWFKLYAVVTFWNCLYKECSVMVVLTTEWLHTSLDR